MQGLQCLRRNQEAVEDAHCMTLAQSGCITYIVYDMLIPLPGFQVCLPLQATDSVISSPRSNTPCGAEIEVLNNHTITGSQGMPNAAVRA